METVAGSRDAIADRVLAIVREALFLPPEQAAEVTLASSFVDDLEIDSLTMVRIDMLIQSRLQLALPLEEASQIGTVGDLVTLLGTRGRPVAASSGAAPATAERGLG